eukprot:m.93242 g.93242  ORF g.93242 m.93242 type:complete len:753 (+) comp13394_c0_seq2:193-2451(+)
MLASMGNYDNQPTSRLERLRDAFRKKLQDERESILQKFIEAKRIVQEEARIQDRTPAYRQRYQCNSLIGSPRVVNSLIDRDRFFNTSFGGLNGQSHNNDGVRRGTHTIQHFQKNHILDDEYERNFDSSQSVTESYAAVQRSQVLSVREQFRRRRALNTETEESTENALNRFEALPSIADMQEKRYEGGSHAGAMSAPLSGRKKKPIPPVGTKSKSANPNNRKKDAINARKAREEERKLQIEARKKKRDEFIRQRAEQKRLEQEAAMRASDEDEKNDAILDIPVAAPHNLRTPSRETTVSIGDRVVFKPEEEDDDDDEYEQPDGNVEGHFHEDQRNLGENQLDLDEDQHDLDEALQYSERQFVSGGGSTEPNSRAGPTPHTAVQQGLNPETGEISTRKTPLYNIDGANPTPSTAAQDGIMENDGTINTAMNGRTASDNAGNPTPLAASNAALSSNNRMRPQVTQSVSPDDMFTPEERPESLPHHEAKMELMSKAPNSIQPRPPASPAASSPVIGRAHRPVSNRSVKSGRGNSARSNGKRGSPLISEQRDNAKAANPNTKKTPKQPVNKKVLPKQDETSVEETNDTASKGVDLYLNAALEQDAAPVAVTLAPCSNCGRKFASERLAKHQTVCMKAAKSKRKVFDPKKARLQGTEAAQFASVADKNDQHYQKKAKKSNWREKSEAFRAAMRAAKDPNSAPAPPTERTDLVPCPSCGRKFNDQAAEKHIPRCKEQSSRPKPVTKGRVLKKYDPRKK